jgi:DNA-binding NarL/FixJ family response regulator
LLVSIYSSQDFDRDRPSVSRPSGGNMKASKVLIADDHEVVRQGIRTVVQSSPNFLVCGEAADGRQAVELSSKLKPDIVIIDIGMPQLNGLDATRQIVLHDPRVNVLVLTMHESEQMVREVLRVGARGYLLKSDAGRDLVSALDALASRKTFFTSKIAEIVLETYLKGPSEAVAKDVLTAREREVVQLLAEGKSTKEVAVALGLSVKTAETHRSNLMRKLSIHSVSQLVLYAVRNNIVQVVPPPVARS